jgi:hypothetical protein
MNQQHVSSITEHSSAAYRTYLAEIFESFWAYRKVAFSGRDDLFESIKQGADRPPVFKLDAADENVVVAPAYSSDVGRRIIAAIPANQRHRWFRSMRSSQALTQSVFGTLSALNKTTVLNGIAADDGLPAFGRLDLASILELEHAVSHLGEPRQSSIDVWIRGPGRVAIECKLTEEEFGTCSRPRLKRKDPRYESQHCNGSYTLQRNRKERCALSEIGVRYWRYIPQLFRWEPDSDHVKCPIRECYQLVRNVLASCVAEDGSLRHDDAHALVLYDRRNPAYGSGGRADGQWQMAIRGIKQPNALRRCSWQRLLEQLSSDQDLKPLLAVLSDKYGLSAGP